MKTILLYLALFHKDQWVGYRWNQKEARAWSLKIRFSDGSIFKLFMKRGMHELFINRAKEARLESTKMHENQYWHSCTKLNPQSAGNRIKKSEMRKYKTCCNHTWTKLISSSSALDGFPSYSTKLFFS